MNEEGIKYAYELISRSDIFGETITAVVSPNPKSKSDWLSYDIDRVNCNFGRTLKVFQHIRCYRVESVAILSYPDRCNSVRWVRTKSTTIHPSWEERPRVSVGFMR